LTISATETVGFGGIACLRFVEFCKPGDSAQIACLRFVSVGEINGSRFRIVKMGVNERWKGRKRSMNAKKRLIALTLAAAAAISAACASVEKQGASETRGPVIAGEHPNSKIPAGHEDPVIAAEPPNPIIAELPDRDIALYAAADGVVLRIGRHERQFDWISGTPREIMPDMQAADFDADGEDELAVILYIGSGTGVSVEELHVVEFDGEGRMEDHVFAESDYVGQLNERLEFRPPDPDRDGAATGEMVVDSRPYAVNLAEFASGEFGRITDRTVLGSIVHFAAEGRKLKAEFGVGIVLETFVVPQYIGAIHADVEYRNGRFRLGDMAFEPHPEYRSP